MLSLPTPASNAPLIDALNSAAQEQGARENRLRRNSSFTSDDSASSVISDTALVLGGRFRLGPEIGRGGDGTVVMALDLRDGERPVAIKQRHCNTVAELQDAIEEALMMARASTLSSQHFPAFVESLLEEKLDSGSRFYDFSIVQEYIGGGGDLLRKLGSLSTTDALANLPLLRWCAELCAAVDALHTLNIVHRDIKPENLLIRSNETLVLCDFGCAVMIDSHATQAQRVVGSTIYLPPEHYNAGREPVRPSFAADAWSVGMVLLEIASARLQDRRGKSKLVEIAAAAARRGFDQNLHWQFAIEQELARLPLHTATWMPAIHGLLRLDVFSRLGVKQAAALAERRRSSSLSIFNPSQEVPEKAAELVVNQGVKVRRRKHQQ